VTLPTIALPTLGDVDVLDGHLLLAAASVSLERLDLRRERPRELVEGIRSAVLLRNGLDVRHAAGECHQGHLNRGHLRGKHGLNLVAWLDALNHRQREISPALRGFSFPARIEKLIDQTVVEVEICRSEGWHF
jgi:hypothetical protein